MQRSRFVRRLLLGFGLLVGLMMTIAALALADLGVASTNAGALQARLSDRLDRVERLRAAAEEAMLAERALMLTHDDGYRSRRADALARYDGLLTDLGRDADAWERPELAALRQTAQLHERNADMAVASGRESIALLSS